MIKAVISGKIVQPLELKKTGEGKDYLKIRVSSKKRMKDEEGKTTYDYVDIVVFGETAKNHYKNLNKGSVITALCRFETSTYTDKNGEKRHGFSFYGEEIDYLYSPKPEDELREYSEDIPLPEIYEG